MTYKEGDFILVPKGTPVWSGAFSAYGDDVTMSKRDMTVEVKYMIPLDDTARKHNTLWWVYLLPEADRTHPARANESKYYKGYEHKEIMADPQLKDQLWNKMQQFVGNVQDFEFVAWGDGKFTLTSKVSPAAAPVRKQAAPSTKQLMVKGTRWRLTEDVTFRWKEYDYTNRVDVEKASGLIPKGTEFTVTGKMSTSYNGAGLRVPIERIMEDGTLRKVSWFYTQIAHIVEPLESVQIPQFVIRDSATGKFYAGEEFTDSTGNGRGWQTKMVDKLTKAKKFDGLGKVKTSMMGIGGYHYGLPGGENMPEWMGRGPGIKIPATWEVLEYEKITKQELAVHDVITWWNNLWRLRPLTMSYGSAVRKVMAEVEKRGLQSTYKGVLMVGNPIVDSTSQWNLGERFYDDEPLDPAVVREADEAVKSVGLGKGKTIRAKSDHSVAWAFENPSQALMAKMSYGGSARMVVINLDTLQELTA